jgi:hypothetical protein
LVELRSQRALGLDNLGSVDIAFAAGMAPSRAGDTRAPFWLSFLSQPGPDPSTRMIG